MRTRFSLIDMAGSERAAKTGGKRMNVDEVWAELRKHLARREQADMDAKRWLTPSQFRRRCSQTLRECEQRRPGQEFSFWQKLIRGGCD